MIGHSNISTTKQYARIVDTLIIDEMKKVQELYHIPGTSASLYISEKSSGG
jgi:hypothetical protein